MSELVSVVTPVGELHYVHISGQGKQNYNEDGYNYVATIHIPKKEAQPLIDKIEEILGEVKKGEVLKSKGFRELLKDEDGVYYPTSNTTDRDADAEPTGIIAFVFSTSTTFADGKTKKISVYNSANPPTKINLGEAKIGNGSKGAISGKLKRYVSGKSVGVSLFLNAVQLVEFIEYSEDAGFEAQEDGYVGNQESFAGNSETDEKPKEDAAEAKTKVKAKPKL